MLHAGKTKKVNPAEFIGTTSDSELWHHMVANVINDDLAP